MSLRTVILSLTAALAKAACPAPSEPKNGMPMVADDYKLKLLLGGLRAPRDIIFDKEGNLLFAQGGIVKAELEDYGGLDICVTNQTTLVSNPDFRHGIALSEDNSVLFITTSTDLYAYPYDPSAASALDSSEAKHLITGMEQEGYHQTRTLLVPQHNPDLLLISRGSDGNIDMPTLDIDSGRSQIRYWNIEALMKEVEEKGEPVAYNASGTVLGWGLRNSVGVGEHPVTGGIFSVENSMDDMIRFGEDIHNDNPGEELNYHGIITSDEKNPYEGKNYGYPVCFAIWNTTTVENLPVDVETGLQMANEGGVDRYDDEYCLSKTQPPILTFPAHTAPLDIKFLSSGEQGFITFHGSWDREPPNGYRLSRIAWDSKKGMPTAPSTSQDAETHIVWNPDNSKCPNSCIRPVGLAIDETDRIFMTSDQTGEIFVITSPKTATTKEEKA